MPLPLSRDVTLVANDPVPSSLLNNLQDWLIAVYHKVNVQTRPSLPS